MQRPGKQDMGDRASRYRVFLSYAHVDRHWARRVSRLLETWKVPRRLVGTESAFGPVPRTLGPVFRDRDELSASAELGATINRALQESAAMVVICSPAAARSRWVNEEIRTFKALGRGDRRQYRFMHRIFSNARRRLDLAENDEERQSVLRALGDAALDEHAEWILMHRERPLEHGKL